MARLSARERAALPDSAFAYVDSAGKRRLPINDESHVRNALSRFGQVDFETEDARQASRRKLLNAAKRHGIVPVGFIEGEFQSARRRSAAGRLLIELSDITRLVDLEAELRRALRDRSLVLARWAKAEGTYVGCDGRAIVVDATDGGVTYVQGHGRPLIAVLHDHEVLDEPEITDAVVAAITLVAGRELLDEVDDMGVATDGLPTGDVTFLLTDIEGSTPLLRALGQRYASVLSDVRTIIRDAVLAAGGRQVEARADEYVAVFGDPVAAVDSAVAMQRAMSAFEWPEGRDIRVRVGVHSGDITLTESGYVGLTVHTAARIMSAAHGGQVLLSNDSVQRCGTLSGEVGFVEVGSFELRGLGHEHQLHQVVAPGLVADHPAPNV